MHTSCTMMALNVTPPAEDKRAKVDGVVKMEELPSLSGATSVEAVLRFVE